MLAQFALLATLLLELHSAVQLARKHLSSFKML